MMTEKQYLEAIRIAHEEGNTEVVKSLAAKKPKFAPSEDDSIEELTEKAKTDPKGVGMAIVAGVNKGLVDLANLPFDLLNLTTQAIGGLTGVNIPKTATPQSAIDFISEQVTGVRPIELATTPGPSVDTAAERVTGRAAEFLSGGVGMAGALKRVAAQRPGLPPVGVELPRTAPPVTPSYATEAITGTTAGTGFGLAEEVTDNPYLQMGAAVVGGVAPGALTGTARFAGSRIMDELGQFTEKGTRRRVGSALAGASDDPIQAVESLRNNRILVDSILPGNKDVPTHLLTQDDGIRSVVDGVINNNDQLISVLRKNTAFNENELVTELQKIATKGSPSVFANKVTGAVNDNINKLKDELALAQDIAINLENSIQTGQATPAISTRFVDALETSYNRVKQREGELWGLVDKTEKVNTVPLKGKVLRLRNNLKRRGLATSDFPDNLFDEVRTFGGSKNSFEALQNYRSAVLEQIRAATKNGQGQRALVLGELEREIYNFISTSGNSVSHAAASEYTRAFRDVYNKGKLGRFLNLDAQGATRIDPEEALALIVKPNDKIGDVRRSIIAENPPPLRSGEALPPATGLTSAIEDMIRTKFADLSPKARDGFVNRHKNLLKEFPELARDLSIIRTKTDAIAENIAGLEKRRSTLTDQNKTAVAALLGKGPDEIFPTFSKLNDSQITGIADVAKVEGVIDGMQSVYIREIMDKMVSADSNIKRYGLARTLKDNTALNRGYRLVLSPEQRKALSEVEKIANVLTPGAGKTSSSLADLEKAGLVSNLVARILGVQLAGAMPSAGAGSIQRAALMAQGARAVVNSLPSQRTSKLLEEMIVNPKLMEELILLGTKPTTAQEARQLMQTFYFRAGVDAFNEEDQEDDYQGLTIEITRGNENAQ
jgi:hypothetical protein